MKISYLFELNNCGCDIGLESIYQLVDILQRKVSKFIVTYVGNAELIALT